LTAEVVVNAPVETVWHTFTTAEGYRALGAAETEIDFRLGGRLRTYDMQGATAGGQAEDWEILAYDPQRLLAFKPLQQRPDADWTVIYATSVADRITHVRVVLLGHDDSLASQNAARALLERTRSALDRLVERHRPACASCERPK
jgi:uncharacterized protein YndB with AHSA1/START domain